MVDVVTLSEPRPRTSEPKMDIEAVQSANAPPLEPEDKTEQESHVRAFRPSRQPNLHKVRQSLVTPYDRDAMSYPRDAVPSFIKWTRMCEALSKFIPHLQNVFERALNPVLGRLHVYNLWNTDNQQLIFSDTLVDGKVDGFNDLLRSDYPTEVSTRLIVVEDLSSMVMLTLGQSLHVSPEVFEEHLIRSRYGCARVSEPTDFHRPGDPEPEHWNTASLKKDHMSFWWWRPVHRCEDVEIQYLPGMSNILREKRGIGLLPRYKPCYEAVPESIWEERVTILRCETELGSHLLVIVDPLPYVYSENVPDTAKDTRVRAQVPFTQPIPRLPPLDEPVSVRQAWTNGDQYDRYFLQTSSTAESLEAWMSFHNKRGQGPNYRRAVPVLSLLSIISSDTRGFLSGAQVTLKQITEVMLRPMEVEHYNTLDLSRMRLHFFTTELPALDMRLREFVSSCLPNDDIPPISRSELDALLQDMEATIQRCDKVQQALRVELTILESKRAILEAETVTGLTQLAFIFIPLTFAAGLFSINVREFAQPPSITSFVITCVVLLVATYGLRAFQRFMQSNRFKYAASARLQRMLSTGLRYERYVFGRWRKKHDLTWQHFVSYLFGALLTISPPRTRRWLEKLAPSLALRIQTSSGERTQKEDA